MDPNTNQQNKKQIDQIFIADKTKVQVNELQKYFDSNGLGHKIPEGIVNSISKQSYSLWRAKKDKNINKLLLYQILQKAYLKNKQKMDEIEKSVKEFNDKLKKIGQSQIQISVLKDGIKEHKTGHIYNTYAPLFQKHLYAEKMKSLQKKQVIEQQVKAQESKEPSLEKLFQKYCKGEQISQQSLNLLTKQVGQQINTEKIKQFKAAHPKAIDATQTNYSLIQYKKWRQQSKLKQQKKKEQKQIQIQEIKQQGIKKEKKCKNIQKILSKYFKQIEKPPKAQYSYPKFEVQLKLDCSSPIQNSIEFKVKIMVGQKQVTQLISSMSQKKLIQSIKQNEYYIIRIQTKKSQQLQEKIQSYIKMKKIDTEGFKLRTFTQVDKIFISLQFKNQSKDNFLAKIHQVITNKSEQNHCKIEQKLKFGIGSEVKQKPEDRKLIKCLAKGFQFNLNVFGSSNINYRFRKNLQAQNSGSYLFPILALSKNSSLKMRWKKIEDLNSFFNKLGVSDALKTTPSIKQLIGQTVEQIFDSDHKNMDIISIIQTFLSQFDTTQISLINISQKAYAQLSLSNNIKNLLRK